MSLITQATTSDVSRRGVMPAPHRPKIEDTSHMFFHERASHNLQKYGSNSVYNGHYYKKSVYDGSIVILPSDEVSKVKFTTDRLQFVPVTNDAETVAFYEEYLLGNKTVMSGFGTGSTYTHQQVVDRVAELAKSWNGKYGSAFTVRDWKTQELLGSAIFDKARSSKEYRFEVLVKDTLNDGTSAWNKGIGTEITAAMFQGWAVFLTGVPAEEKGSAFETFNDFRPWNADKSLRMGVLTVDAPKNNPIYKIFSHMMGASESKVNPAKSFETARSGTLATRFFTTPDEMRNLRVDRLIMLEMPAPRAPTPEPVNQFDSLSPFDFGTPDGHRGFSLEEVPFQEPSFTLVDEGLSRLDLGSPEMPSFEFELEPFPGSPGHLPLDFSFNKSSLQDRD